MTNSTTSQSFFEEKYLESADPWAFASSAYERKRYDIIVDALGSRRYARAFEPGCSVGVLTSRLSTICDQVEAMDISPTAAGYARERCQGLANVTITCGGLPKQMPAGEFDLLVLSEIGYYFEEDRFAALAECLVQRVTRGGVLLATHWLGTSTDHILSGDRVHEILRSIAGLRHEYSERHSEFRLDRWTRV